MSPPATSNHSNHSMVGHIGHSNPGSTDPCPPIGVEKWPQEYSDELLDYFEVDLFETDPAFKDDRESTSRYIRISFAAMHRMRLRKLRLQLANRAMTMHFKRVEPEDWEDLLKEYSEFRTWLFRPVTQWAIFHTDGFEGLTKHVNRKVTAQRDYNYIQECATGYSNDPFYFTNNTYLDRKFLKRELKKVPSFHREAQKEWEDVDHLGEPIHHREFDDIRGNMNMTMNKENLALRLFVATFGGAFLVGPMWLMVLRDDIKTTLITATAFVAGFGLFISVVPFFITFKGLRIGTDTVLSATAAYAAVLVVFVGTSQSKNF